jgi:hypothetical protein
VSYVPKDYKPPELIVEKGADPIEVTYDVPLKRLPKRKAEAVERM